MRTLFCAVFTILTFSTVVFGQSSHKPLLLGKSSPYAEDQDMLYHGIESTLQMFVKDPNALLAIRICSSDPLPIAFLDAGAVNWVTRQFNEQLDYLRNRIISVDVPPARIYYLRNDIGCGFYKNISLTEYWFVPSIADFPEHLEISRPENVTESNLISFSKVDERMISPEKPEEYVPLIPTSYEVFKINLVKKLRKDKTALLLISYPSYGAMRTTIYRNAGKLKLYLTAHGIRAQRIFIKEMTGDYFDEERKDAVYPNVSIFPGMMSNYQFK